MKYSIRYSRFQFLTKRFTIYQSQKASSTRVRCAYKVGVVIFYFKSLGTEIPFCSVGGINVVVLAWLAERIKLHFKIWHCKWLDLITDRQRSSVLDIKKHGCAI
jgi:hypothetical protein